MTITETTTETTTGTLKPAELVRALEAVTPHAGTDLTLPMLCSVRFEAVGGELWLVCTDRYSLGTYRLDWDGPDVAGLLPAAHAKELLRFAKTTDRAWRDNPCLGLTIGERELAVADFERKQAWPLDLDHTFVNWQAVMPTYTPDAPCEDGGIGVLGATAANLAKFVKGASKDGSLAFTFGASPVKPVVVTDTADERFRGLLMPARLSGVA